MFTQAIDPRLTAHAVFTAERNARTKYDLYDAFFSVDGFMADTVYIVHKEDETRRYTVRLDEKSRPVSCTCKFASKNSICLHQFVIARKQEESAELETFEEEMDAKDFMLECSREHNIGFSAEVYDDTVASYGA